MSKAEFDLSKEEPLRYKRISIDIDGVVAMSPIPVLDYVNQKYGLSLSLGQFTYFGFIEQKLQEELGLSEEESWQIWYQPVIMKIAPPVEQSVSVVQELTSRGAEIFFITGRAPSLREITYQWFQEHLPFISTERILIRNDHATLHGIDFKMQKIKELSPQIHLDDLPEMVSLIKELPETQLILVKQNWNQEAPPTVRKNWLEIYRFLISGK